MNRVGRLTRPVISTVQSSQLALGTGPVVADVVEWDWGDEAVVHEALQGGLRVEGVLPCEGGPWRRSVRPTDPPFPRRAGP